MYVIDANVISELSKPQPFPSVVRWMTNAQNSCYLDYIYYGSLNAYLKTYRDNAAFVYKEIKLDRHTGTFLIQGTKAIGGEVSGDLFVPYYNRVLWVNFLSMKEREIGTAYYSLFSETTQFVNIINGISLGSLKESTSSTEGLLQLSPQTAEGFDISEYIIEHETIPYDSL
ncbi:MAG: hypothetical protein LBI64_03045 [Coriobacteriales bacterium]|jgi:hypothetical protein|nr:hypothetical protein [Coriobacteriales bacterium]